jgi:hypothetical protein
LIEESRKWAASALSARLQGTAAAWWQKTITEIAAGVSDEVFVARLSMASRHVRGTVMLEPTSAECDQAATLHPGWNPERWTLQETLRVALILARTDVLEASFVDAFEEAFRTADEGECRALYRCLALLPDGERFVWRAGEGCRTNIGTVFQAVTCDSPYAAAYFDDTAWNQLCIKAVFVGAPLWRVHGLDGRLSEDLARIALDLMDERRSAGRDLQPDLWLCLGSHGGGRARAAIELELAQGPRNGRIAATYALGRCLAEDRLRELAAGSDPDVADAATRALAGQCGQYAWAPLDPLAAAAAPLPNR